MSVGSDADDDESGPSARLQLSVDPQTIAYLKALALTGTYGRKPSKVAKALIEEGVRRAISDRLIEVIKADSDG